MELLELVGLLYGARDRFTTIQVAWQYTYEQAAMDTITARWMQGQTPGSVATLRSVSATAAPTLERHSLRRHIWWRKPDCWRDENSQMVTILCGGRAAYFEIGPQSPEQAAFQRQIQASLQANPPDIEDRIDDAPLLDPAFLLASHRLEPLHDTVHAGRAAVAARATYRKGKSRSYEPMFWTTADSYMLTVDRERGILLRYAALLDGEEFAVASVDEVVFDAPIAVEVFTLS